MSIYVHAPFVLLRLPLITTCDLFGFGTDFDITNLLFRRTPCKGDWLITGFVRKQDIKKNISRDAGMKLQSVWVLSVLGELHLRYRKSRTPDMSLYKAFSCPIWTHSRICRWIVVKLTLYVKVAKFADIRLCKNQVSIAVLGRLREDRIVHKQLWLRIGVFLQLLFAWVPEIATRQVFEILS